MTLFTWLKKRRARLFFKRLRRDIVRFNQIMIKAQYDRHERRRLKRELLSAFKSGEDIEKYEAL